MSFSLLDEPFIRFTRLDGSLDSGGVLQVVREAHQIRELTFASPQDNFATHRFLLVVLHWIGAKAEVLAPQFLLEEIIGDLTESFTRYQPRERLTASTMPSKRRRAK